MQWSDHPLYGKGSNDPKREEGCISGAWTRAFTYAATCTFFVFCGPFLFLFPGTGVGRTGYYLFIRNVPRKGPTDLWFIDIFCGSFSGRTGTGPRLRSMQKTLKYTIETNLIDISIRENVQVAKSRYIPQVGCCCESYELWAMFTNKVSRVFAALLTLCTTTRN